MGKILSGKPVADAVIAEAAKRSSELRQRGIVPALAFVRTGTSEHISQYEQQVLAACEAAQVEAQSAFMPDYSRLETTLRNINRDNSIHGVIFMHSMPSQEAEDYMRANLNYLKDVDGISRSSLAALFAGHGNAFAPCPARAAYEMLKFYDVALEGKHALLIGSMVVSKPLAMLLLNRGVTVTLCAHDTPNLVELCRASDIIVTSAGIPGLLGAECFREGQTVLDVGDSLSGEGHAGDVDEAAALAAGADVAPVIGGVETVSCAFLAMHTVQAAQLQNGLM